MIGHEFAKECHIFLCYRSGGAEIAKNFKKALSSIGDRYFGYVWYSDQENIGNFVQDIASLISTAKYAVIFIDENFTKDFLLGGKNNYGDMDTGDVGCVTVREIVEIERQRQLGNLTVIGVHINDYILQPADISVLKRVFLNEGILTDTSLSAYTELNRNAYFQRTTDIDVFAAALSRGMEKKKIASSVVFPKVNLDLLIPPLGYHYYGRETTFSLVDEAKKNKTCINIAAPAGSGKSSFVFHWLSRMASQQYYGAEYVLYWSFEQGNSECAISSNLSRFFEFALSFFGIEHISDLSSELEKADALCSFMQEHSVILVLDGIDAFQLRGEKQEVLLQNHSIKKIITSITRSVNNKKSLLLLLSVALVSELQYYPDQAEIIFLPKITINDGVKIFRDIGVNGNEQELALASNELNCDPMSITLLGKLLVSHYNGSIKERYRVKYTSTQLEQAEHIFSFYESLWSLDTKEGIVLSLCCLFRRGTDYDSLQYLLTRANIPELDSTNEIDIKYIVGYFKKVGLIYGEYEINILPAVKERYRRRFQDQKPDIFYKCNYILGDYHASLCDDENITTIAEMLPLYDSVFYYTQANEPSIGVSILWNRIFRRRQFFSQKRLGATTDDLFTITLFFDVTNNWSPHPKLSKIDAAWLSSVAAYLQNNIGNLRESETLRRRELDIYKSMQHHLFLASDGQNLARNLMLQGKLEESEQEFVLSLAALDIASGQSYEKNIYANDIDVEQLRTNILTRYAYLLYLRGYWERANKELNVLSTKCLMETTTGMFYYYYIRLHTANASQKGEVCDEIEKIYLSSFDSRKRHETAYANLLLAQVSFIRATGIYKRKKLKMCLSFLRLAIDDAKKAGRMDQIPLILNETLDLYLSMLEQEKIKSRKKDLLVFVESLIYDLEEAFSLNEIPIYKIDYLFLKIRYYANVNNLEQAHLLYESLCHSSVCMRYFSKKIQSLALLFGE